ncbi:MAG: hypothetical protein JXR64_00470 [Spirochaetales bacterium]|nr:hypothetical protein [Spirochaetales bacterium]
MLVTDDKLFNVAVDYYINKKKQKEIAKEYNVSTVQISKYLKLAEKRNIVTISVNPPNVSKEDLEWYQIMFKQLFKIDNLILTPGADNTEKSTNLLVNFATKYLFETYKNTNYQIGIGLGKTMYAMCDMVNETELKNKWVYYPVCATIHNKSSKYFDYEKMLNLASKNWGGSFNSKVVDMLNFSNNHELNLQLPISQYFDNLDILLTGIGSAFTLHPATREMFFSSENKKDILTQNLVGDVVNFFLDVDGNIYEPEMIRNQISLKQIQNTKQVIAVASGFHKVESIIGALRSGLITTLITDIQTAKHVIEYLK